MYPGIHLSSSYICHICRTFFPTKAAAFTPAKMIFVSPFSDDGGCQAGEEERPAPSGEEAQSENEDSRAAHREQFALAAVH